MGKLAPAYLDNVLTWKLKTLIQGAIERQKLECIPKSEDGESTEPMITYDRFVEALSVRDSFTATIVELLVKEIADRQTRPVPHETSYIGNNTRKTLRRLSTHYTERTNRPSPSSRPPLPVSSFHDHLEDDSAEFQNMVDYNVEGAQIDSSLYEAFSSPEHTWPAPGILSSLAPNRDDSPPFLPPPRSPPVFTHTGSNPWAPHSAVFMTSSSSSFARPPSVRRPYRPATQIQQFRDFTSRRRSSSRLLTEIEEERRSPAMEEMPPTPVLPTRRPLRRLQRSLEPLGETAETATRPHSLPTPSPSSPSSNPETPDDEPETNAPPRHRLRRGGILAPEAMLSRYASPSLLTIAPPDASSISQRAE